MSRTKTDRVRIPLGRSLAMIGDYASNRIGAQFRALAFVVLYLALAQLFFLRVPIQGALGAALGIGAVALGLALFLEGLFLGVMPLGEVCGLRLPAKAKLPGIILFSLVLGALATIAEPAIGFLKALGGSVLPWRAPLLYLVLNRGSSWLVAAIASGVGVAVVLGVLRFLKGWSLKPFIFATIPALLLATFFIVADPRIASAAALAWDAGGITTGPVTVPLVIALGIGISRRMGRGEEAGTGLGVVTLASAFPVLAVLCLALVLGPMVPAPSQPEAFFASENRKAALFVLGDEEKLATYALAALGPEGAAAAGLGAAIAAAPPDAAPPARDSTTTGPAVASSRKASALAALRQPLVDALKAVLPLALVLILVLTLFLKEKIANLDELGLGLVFAVLGMLLFGLGMDRGLGNLGRQSGKALPKAYVAMELPEKAVELGGVEPAMILEVAGTEGARAYLPAILPERPGEPSLVPFDPTRYDADAKVYRHVPVERALFAGAPLWAGYAAVIAFVFAMGIGATLAEPSLAALGATLEELTTGTYKSSALIRAVAVGVGCGMGAGFARILFDLPLLWILVPPYALALVLTAFASEDFTAIAWDSAGVTTGPITVPLVIAAGLGVGDSVGAVDGFGVVAAASAFPVLAVLAMGLVSQARSRRSLEPASAD